MNSVKLSRSDIYVILTQISGHLTIVEHTYITSHSVQNIKTITIKEDSSVFLQCEFL